MPEIIATGPGQGERSQRTFQDGETIRLGRAARYGWSTPWDLMISREHADLRFVEGRLLVRCLETAVNPLIYKGRTGREISVALGEEFRIGKTTFTVVEAVPVSTPKMLMGERAFSSDELRRHHFKNADHRLDALSLLPTLIQNARSDEDLAYQLVRLLLRTLPHADAAAVVHYHDLQNSDLAKPSVLRWDARNNGLSGRFSPSRRLIMAALNSSDTVLHFWGDVQPTGDNFTINGNFDWAFCTPLTDESSRGWCLYVTGQLEDAAAPNMASPDFLTGDLRFAEMLAKFLGAFRRVRVLEHRQAGLSQFFSPAVLETLMGPQSETLLQPKVGEISVLFCDVRGFARKAEQAYGDLPALLQRVSTALGVMTRGIVKYEGVIADFQGDAALGFWGWPVPLSDGPLEACRAALDIYAGFAAAMNDSKHLLNDFRVGIGVAHGQAIAGKIGTEEQAKVGAFGPVVNLGSRLEGMTKLLGVPILIDEATAAYVRNDPAQTIGRCRRLGRMRPYGLATPLMVSELLPPAKFPGTLTDEYLTTFEHGVDLLIAGQWGDARAVLESLSDADPARTFLLNFMSRSDFQVPHGWDGIIPLDKK